MIRPFAVDKTFADHRHRWQEHFASQSAPNEPERSSGTRSVDRFSRTQLETASQALGIDAEALRRRLSSSRSDSPVQEGTHPELLWPNLFLDSELTAPRTGPTDPEIEWGDEPDSSLRFPGWGDLAPLEELQQQQHSQGGAEGEQDMSELLADNFTASGLSLPTDIVLNENEENDGEIIQSSYVISSTFGLPPGPRSHFRGIIGSPLPRTLEDGSLSLAGDGVFIAASETLRQQDSAWNSPPAAPRSDQSRTLKASSGGPTPTPGRVEPDYAEMNATEVTTSLAQSRPGLALASDTGVSSKMVVPRNLHDAVPGLSEAIGDYQAIVQGHLTVPAERQPSLGPSKTWVIPKVCSPTSRALWAF